MRSNIATPANTEIRPRPVCALAAQFRPQAEREWICGITRTTTCPAAGDPNCPKC